MNRPYWFSCDTAVGMQLLCQTHGPILFLARESGFGHTSVVCYAFQGKLLTALEREITDSYFSPGVGVKTHKKLHLIISQCWNNQLGSWNIKTANTIAGMFLLWLFSSFFFNLVMDQLLFLLRPPTAVPLTATATVLRAARGGRRHTNPEDKAITSKT